MFNVQRSDLVFSVKLTESDNAPLHVQQTLDPDSPSSLMATARDNGIDMIVRVLRFGILSFDNKYTQEARKRRSAYKGEGSAATGKHRKKGTCVNYYSQT